MMKGTGKETLALAAAGAGVLLAARALYRRRLEYDLRGKTVLITGGSRGLGLRGRLPPAPHRGRQLLLVGLPSGRFPAQRGPAHRSRLGLRAARAPLQARMD